MIVSLISILVLVSIVCLIYIIKYSKVKSKIDEYNNLVKKIKDAIDIFNSPLRQGYYKMRCTQNGISYESIVHVIELDKYTNGDSKIKIKEIEIDCGDGKLDYQSAKNFTTRNFVSIFKTSDITWLESEITTKQIRKDKLKHLTEVISEK